MSPCDVKICFGRQRVKKESIHDVLQSQGRLRAAKQEQIRSFVKGENYLQARNTYKYYVSAAGNG